MAGRVLDKYGPEHQRPVDRCDADIIKQLSVGEWKQKADRMRSGFYRHTTDFRAIVKYIGLTFPQLEILQKDIRLKYREDECLKEEDFIRIVDVISDIDGLLARLSPPPLGKRRFEDVDVAPKATTSKSVKDLSAEQMLSVLSKTSLIQWRRIADDLPEYLHRMRYRVTPKDIAQRFDLDLTQINVAMDEAQFFCSGEHVIGDRNLRALEDVVLRMPELIASITRRLGSELESQSKRPRVEPEVRPAVAPAQPMPTGLSRVIGGALSLSQDEWKKVEKTFAVIAERRRGTPADVCEVCSLSGEELNALMAEARFSCQSHSALSLNNLSRLHDLIQKKANDSSAVEAAASAHRADDLKTLSLRPAEGWKKVQSRLQSFFVEKITTPALMEKASGISPVQMAAILRQTQLSDDPEHVLSSDQFQKIFRFLDGLSANAVVAGPADPVQSTVQSPVEKVVAKASELPAAVLTEAAAPAPAPKPIISVLSPRRYRKITVEELIAAGGDPDVLEDVFSEYVDDSLDDVDEDILEHLLASGFLVVATENDQHRRDGSENSAPGAVKREVAVKDQPSESTAPADDCPCDVCGICGHSSSRCQLAVQRKRGLELNFIQIGRLGKEKIIDIRSACRKSGRLSKDISPQEARNIENAFNKLLGGNERR